MTPLATVAHEIGLLGYARQDTCNDLLGDVCPHCKERIAEVECKFDWSGEMFTFRVCAPCAQNWRLRTYGVA